MHTFCLVISNTFVDAKLRGCVLDNTIDTRSNSCRIMSDRRRQFLWNTNSTPHSILPFHKSFDISRKFPDKGKYVLNSSRPCSLLLSCFVVVGSAKEDGQSRDNNGHKVKPEEKPVHYHGEVFPVFLIFLNFLTLPNAICKNAYFFGKFRIFRFFSPWLGRKINWRRFSSISNLYQSGFVRASFTIEVQSSSCVYTPRAVTVSSWRKGSFPVECKRCSFPPTVVLVVSEVSIGYFRGATVGLSNTQ